MKNPYQESLFRSRIRALYMKRTNPEPYGPCDFHAYMGHKNVVDVDRWAYPKDRHASKITFRVTLNLMRTIAPDFSLEELCGSYDFISHIPAPDTSKAVYRDAKTLETKYYTFGFLMDRLMTSFVGEDRAIHVRWARIPLSHAVGISPATLSGYLEGRSDPPFPILTRILRALNITLTELIEGKSYGHLKDSKPVDEGPRDIEFKLKPWPKSFDFISVQPIYDTRRIRNDKHEDINDMANATLADIARLDADNAYSPELRERARQYLASLKEPTLDDF